MPTQLRDVERAKEEFLYVKELLVRRLADTPDDRLAWSPSPTARTPLALVAHSAESIGHITEMFWGSPYPAATPAQADAEFLEREREYATREAVLEFLDRNAEGYVEMLDSLTPERLEETIEMPFGLGRIPVSMALGAARDHTLTHVAQLDYVQTAYGDRDWHI